MIQLSTEDLLHIAERTLRHPAEVRDIDNDAAYELVVAVASGELDGVAAIARRLELGSEATG